MDDIWCYISTLIPKGSWFDFMYVYKLFYSFNIKDVIQSRIDPVNSFLIEHESISYNKVYDSNSYKYKPLRWDEDFDDWEHFSQYTIIK